MKYLFCTLVFCLVSILTIHAQSSSLNSNSATFNFKDANKLLASNTTFSNHAISFAYDEKDKAFYEGRLKKAKKQKLVGIILTSIGAAGLIASITAAVVVSRTDPADVSSSSTGVFVTGTPVLIGAVGGLASAALLGPGIPFWIIGAHKEKKYKKTLAGIK
ncbi:MAG: hypothetical protein JWN78_937 [Bacteroidota bacterium]|nr:hypothetical protein [Bacteroidota bacterium]